MTDVVTVTRASRVGVLHKPGHPTSMHISVDGQHIKLDDVEAARKLMLAAVEAVGRLNDAAEREANARPRGSGMFTVVRGIAK